MNRLLTLEIEKAGYDEGMSILSNVTFNVTRGELVGLIGPNGAGKSTTIKTILGMNEHYKGTIHFDSKREIAYIPEKPVYYFDMTLWEHIELTAALLQLEEKSWTVKVKKLLKTFELEHVIHETPATFSKGMQQKSMLIFAFMTNASLYIVDEPFIGLDPNATKKLLLLLEEEQKRGAGILMSTHVLDTAEKICDRFVLLLDGKIEATGTMEEIQTTCGLLNSSLLDCFYFLSNKEPSV
ncbi:ABC transporter ATP-binding protein [Sutcliffiella sp. NC1]|uniref:ABC transporter ATP-binding protein n=1 Tax=Sutcliffiella sp. NC1 TaxID=3004096 RepID=UPI0022DE04A8|nr:ABC transporter ATP-binding protein [Sutcliffiella sp. NC1]WBL14180.1 ABC transporter ATP-binding protein [Sutcliffiella sp. NC1]